MELMKKASLISLSLLVVILLSGVWGETVSPSNLNPKEDEMGSSKADLSSGKTDLSSGSIAGQFSSLIPEEEALPRVEVKLISEDINGVTFQVSFPYPQMIEEQFDGQTFTSFYIPTNFTSITPGKPEFPAQVIAIGIPTDSVVKVSAEAGPLSQILLDSVPKPVPYAYPIEGREDFPQLELEYSLDDATYYKGEMYPLLHAELFEEGTCRGYHIAKIIVNPLVYNSANGSVEFYQDIKVRVDFFGATLTPQGVLAPEEMSKGEREIEQVLKNLLLNYTTASTFFKQPIESLPTSDGMTPYDLYAYGVPFKLYILNEGVYKVTHGWLLQNGFSPEGVDPRTIKIFCGDRRELYYDTPDEIPANDYIFEIPIYFEGDDDGSFDPGDYFLMFGTGTTFCDDEYNYFKSDYTEYNVYWMSYGGEPGLRMEMVDGTPQDTTPLVENYMSWRHYEEQVQYKGGDHDIPEESDEWYWFILSPSESQPITNHDTPFNISNHIPDDMTIRFRIQGYQGSGGDQDNRHHTTLYLNETIEQFKIYENDDPSWAGYAYIEETVNVNSSLFHEGTNIFWVEEYFDPTFYPPLKEDRIFFDWFDVGYKREFVPENDWILFQSPSDQTGMVRYHIGPFTSKNIFVIDYTNYRWLENIEITGDSEGGYYAEFQAMAEETTARYAGATNNSSLFPRDIRPDAPSNLHDPNNTADYIIIAYDDFIEVLEPLASFRQSQGYMTKLIKAEDVYEEFSRGLFDPTAIRNFLFFAYHNWEIPPAYVLLVGDAFFDYKDHLLHQQDRDNIYIHHGQNKIPAHYTETYPHDNWYACLDFDDHSYYPDLILSRICPHDIEKCASIVDKIILYETEREYDDWHIELTFVADNNQSGEPGSFTKDCENKISNLMPLGFRPHRIYMESMDWDESWNDPEHLGNRKLYTRANLTPYLREHFDGAWVQFCGHGSYNVWCHEYLYVDFVVDPESPWQDWHHPEYHDFQLLTNYKRFPIVSMMSCNLSFFDHYIDSCGEKLLVPTNRGAIATFGSTRLGRETYQDVYHGLLYEAFFPDRKLNDPCITVGQAYLHAKLYCYEEVRLEHVLLGDPAVRPPFPTKPINCDPIASTIQRGQNLHFSATVANQPNFNGIAVVNIYDNIWYCKSDNPGVTEVYHLRPLNSMKLTVTDGQIEGDIIIPVICGEAEDDPIETHLQIYAYDEENGIGAVLLHQVTTNVIGSAPQTDFTGPDITITAGGEHFRDGDYIPPKCLLEVTITDPSGVLSSTDNTIDDALETRDDIAIPQPILLRIISPIGEKSYDLTHRFNPALDDPTTGTASIGLDFNEGKHTIVVTAYDNFLNTTTESVTVIVGSENTLRNLLVCPNPFSTDTYFTFESQVPLQSVKIQVFTVAGRKIAEIYASNQDAGYNEIYWDGRDQDGNRLANGVYLYKIIADDGQSYAEEFGKLVVMR